MTPLRALALAEQLGGRNRLNCIAELDRSAAEHTPAADTPLGGMPVLVKDNIDVRGMHTTAGSLALADNLATEDAPVIANLRKNGAILLGKTNMTEFANFTTQGMPGGYSSRGGQVVHAVNPALSPSGSSSGSAVAVAAGIVPAAVGTDTSFSVVACAQHNGICGLKPPAGALSSQGIIPIARTLDSAGSLANNLTDTLRLYSAMRDDPLPALEALPVNGLKIGVNTANQETVSDGQKQFLSDFLQTLRSCGGAVQSICQEPAPLLPVVMKYEFRPHLEDYLRTSAASRKTLAEIVAFYEAHPEAMKYGISLLKSALEDTPGGLQSPVYLDAMENRRIAIKKTAQELSGLDAVIMTGPTSIMHFCGFASLCIVGQRKNADGMRRGLILYGSDEIRLYRAALALEKLLKNIA